MLTTPEKGPMPTAVLADMVMTYTVKGVKLETVWLDTMATVNCWICLLSKFVTLMM